MVLDKLGSGVVGQDLALVSVEDMLYRIKADIGEKSRPLAVNLLLGPTGVGKTSTAEIIAEEIHGDSDYLCRIDMNTLSSEHYAASLLGSPPGYVGSKENYTLLDKDKIEGDWSRPGCVLFDEIEKADSAVIRALLNIFDRGVLELSSGMAKIDFTNTIIFCTSNIGSDVPGTSGFFGQYASFGKLRKKQKHQDNTRALLTEHFDPEFINRFDYVLQYDALDRNSLAKVIDVEIDRMNKRLASHAVSVLVDEGTKIQIGQRCDFKYGMRDVSRTIRKLLEPKIAKAMLESPDATEFYSLCKNGVVTVRSK